MKKLMGRDEERVRVSKSAPSHGSQAHKTESEKNKKATADLKKGKK